jgi:hypothetical protein
VSLDHLYLFPSETFNLKQLSTREKCFQESHNMETISQGLWRHVALCMHIKGPDVETVRGQVTDRSEIFAHRVRE